VWEEGGAARGGRGGGGGLVVSAAARRVRKPLLQDLPLTALLCPFTIPVSYSLAGAWVAQLAVSERWRDHRLEGACVHMWGDGREAYESPGNCWSGAHAPRPLAALTRLTHAPAAWSATDATSMVAEYVRCIAVRRVREPVGAMKWPGRRPAVAVLVCRAGAVLIMPERCSEHGGGCCGGQSCL